MQANYQYMNPFLGAADADNMLRIAESFGSFGTYANEGTSEGLGETLPQRFDAAMIAGNPHTAHTSPRFTPRI